MYDLVVVGAGPYGLSVAAHAGAAGLSLRLLGRPMASWRDHMPRGMFLQSEPGSSSLSDPGGACTLPAYCAERNIPVQHGRPLPLDVFTEYGRWFGRRAAPAAEEATVLSVAPHAAGFRVVTAEGETLVARAVALAPGIVPFARRPAALVGLPAELAAHSSGHRDLSRFRGSDVTVVGAGQSALETAALLAEEGADVRVVARADRLVWNAPPQPPRRGPLTALRDPHCALGIGRPGWIWSELPWAVRGLPAGLRMHIARHAPGPAGAWWLRERFDSRVPVLLCHRLVGVDRTRAGGACSAVGAPDALDGKGVRGERVRLRLVDAAGVPRTVATDHVVAATGFAPELNRLELLGGGLRDTLRRVGGGDAPLLSGRFESSYPGLFFAGLLTAPSFGPSMRFVHGTAFTAPRLVDGVRRHVAVQRRAGVHRAFGEEEPGPAVGWAM